MIKIIIKINEETSEKTDNLLLTNIEVKCEEIGKNASKNEIYVSDLLKERMHIDKKEETINLTSKTKDEILEELLKSL